MAPVDVPEVLSQAVSDSLMVTSDPTLQIPTACGRESPRLLGDREALRVALKNLIVNAIRHGQGSPIRVAARALRADGTQVVIEVEDEGPGIPDDELPSIFDSFFRGRKATDGQIEGSGIGLSVVYHVVRAHGGQVRASQVHPHGTRFTLQTAGARTSRFGDRRSRRLRGMTTGTSAAPTRPPASCWWTTSLACARCCRIGFAPKATRWRRRPTAAPGRRWPAPANTT